MIMGPLVKNDAVIALFFSANYLLNVYPKYIFITFDESEMQHFGFKFNFKILKNWIFKLI